MILVDTTVWIDFFLDHNCPHVDTLQKLIQENEELSICGIVLTEVLQGIRSDSSYKKTKRYFETLIYLPMQYSTFIQSASLYRTLRKKGVTIRKPVDCMIAQVALDYQVSLLHNDRDFEYIAKHSNLKII
jgi:predicted nucleic acid-binding protein